MKQLLVLDLDETLIHSAYAPIPHRAIKGQLGFFYLYERPYLKEFMDGCAANFNLAIWSASKANYVRWIIRSTVLSGYSYDFVKTRKDCKRTFSNDGRLEYQKDLTSYLTQYDRVIMLDDFPKMVVPIDCCIKAPEYLGGADGFLMNSYWLYAEES